MARTILITGGSRGIGAEIVRTFAEKDTNIVFCYKNNKESADGVVLEANKKGANCIAVKCDVTNEVDVQKFVGFAMKFFGTIDVCVCNSGIAENCLLIDQTAEHIKEIIDTNLIGVINVCKEAAKVMVSNQSGKIVNISSMWGISGASCESVYSASKAGVIGFSKAIAKELGTNGINVNVVAPGVIETDMMKEFGGHIREQLKAQTVLNRLGTPQDVANVVKFLASEEASYITGQVISIDGGFIG